MDKIRKDLEEGRNVPLYKLSGGMMNKSFVVDINGKQYVWYTPTKQANEMVNRQVEKEVQAIIYELGITSKNLAFFDDGTKINEFIPGDSLNNISSYDIKKVSIILKKLHSSKKLCKLNYEPFKKVLSYKLEAENLGIKFDNNFYFLLDTVLKEREYLESQKLALCHNDFQKSNIIQTPDDNYFMIDFEFAMNNDPYFDIAAFGNGDVNEGYLLLKEYTNNCFSKEDVKRFCYWRILLSLQWYLVALIKDIRGEGKIHNFDFKQVAMHFLNNAQDALDLFNKETK